MKNILAIWGKEKQGKSETIKKLVPLFQAHYPNAKLNWLINGDDIKLIIEVDNKKIGIESQGDPYSRQAGSLNDFAQKENCDLIICASRTRSETVHNIERIADEYDYEITWATNYRSASNQTVLNQISAEHIFQLILTLI